MATHMDHAGNQPERLWLLLLAAVQAAALIALHYAATALEQPAASFHWLWPLYGLAILAPLSGQVLAAYRRRREFWRLLGGCALALAAVASYSGWRALVEGRSYSYWSGDAFAFGAIMAACWLLLLPFAQQRLDRGGWRIAYGDYFSGLLDNAARLAGAAAFAGAFWLLLLLAAGLSDVLGIRFVGKQIAQPYFIYSATALAFAAGLSLPQVKSAVYRGSLAALGWLLPLVSLIAALFLAALPFTGLQALWQTGHASALMLCLQAALLLLFNAAWQDGGGQPALTPWLRRAVSYALLAAPGFTALCAYALSLRVQQYGWSADRVWAALAIAVVGWFAVGYALAALNRDGAWMAGAAGVNLTGLPASAALLLATLTPLLDPERIATASQVDRLLSGAVEPAQFDFAQLRFRSGRAGNAALRQLAALQNHPQAETLRGLAQNELDRADEIALHAKLQAEDVARHLRVYPGGETHRALLGLLAERANAESYRYPCLNDGGGPCPLLAIDLNGDGVQERVLILENHSLELYGTTAGAWRYLGGLRPRQGNATAQGSRPTMDEIRAALDKGEFRALAPQWRDVEIGGWRYGVD